MLIVFAVILLTGCGAGVMVGTYWHFGDGGSNYGTVSIQNRLGYTSYFYVGSTSYGPIRHGETLLIQLRSGTYFIRSGFGQSRYINIRRTETIFIVFS